MASQATTVSASESDAQDPDTFKILPPVLVMPAHFTVPELQSFEERLLRRGVPLTYDAAEARILIGKVERKKRALLELRSRRVITEEIDEAEQKVPPRKKAKLDVDDADDRSGRASDAQREAGSVAKHDHTLSSLADSSIVRVVRCQWIDDSDAAGRLLPLGKYTVYAGRRVARLTDEIARRTKLPSKPATLERSRTLTKPQSLSSAILERAKADAPGTDYRVYFQRPHAPLQVNRAKGPPQLLHETTSDHEGVADIPPPPEWVVKGYKYACQRSTPVNTPNADFIDLLKEIRLTRTLQSDEIGVRAYSTTIAAIAAYPHTITHRVEVSRLPGCNEKTAGLWSEWSRTGQIREVEEARGDEQLQILKIFYEIWGVGARGARAFYGRGRRDLDDIIEFEWSSLSRVQQIGLKYYDEFMIKIPRDEIEYVRDRILEAFREIVRRRDGNPDDCRECIVGGYRRGKVQSGDVDVVLSHLDEEYTQDVIAPLIELLAGQGWITHNLITYTSGSQRGQATLPFQGGDSHGGHGFDSLDKSLVVWQDLPSPLPSHWSRMSEDDIADYRKKHPESLQGKPHRRVDIIVAPWSRVGCAVLGWSAGTTFERDLRRYVKHKQAWKFDSSGVRDRATGREIDVERKPDGSRCTTVDEAERMVFDGLGLTYIPPHERATG